MVNSFFNLGVFFFILISLVGFLLIAPIIVLIGVGFIGLFILIGDFILFFEETIVLGRAFPSGLDVFHIWTMVATKHFHQGLLNTIILEFTLT